MIRAIVGENWFRRRERLATLVADFEQEHGAYAVQRLDGATADYGQLVTALQNNSLFAEARMVVIEDLSLNKSAAERLSDLLGLVSGETELIFYEANLDKRGVYYKTLKKQTEFEEYSDADPQSLTRWASEYAQQLGGSIDRSTAGLLVERVGADQTQLARELQKLVQYNPTVSNDTVRLLSEQTPQSTIFQLVDLAFSGNVAAALKLYDDQRAQRKEPQAILGMLVWQLHLVAVCAVAPHATADQLARDTGLKSFSLSKARTIASRMGASRVRQVIHELCEIDRMSKQQTYQLDDGLKYLLQRLAY